MDENDALVSYAPEEVPEPKKSHTGLAIVIVIIVILVLAGLGVGAYFLVKKKKKPKPTTGSGSNGNNNNTPTPTPTPLPAKQVDTRYHFEQRPVGAEEPHTIIPDKPYVPTWYIITRLVVKHPDNKYYAELAGVALNQAGGFLVALAPTICYDDVQSWEVRETIEIYRVRQFLNYKDGVISWQGKPIESFIFNDNNLWGRATVLAGPPPSPQLCTNYTPPRP